MSRTPVEIDYFVIANPAMTAQTMVLPGFSELEDNEARARGLLTQAEEECASTDESTHQRGEARKDIAERMLTDIATAKEKLESLRQAATRKSVMLLKPTYGMLLKAEGESKTLDTATGEYRVDRGRAVSSLLLQSVEGQAVRDMDPVEARYLEGKLYGLLWPEEEKFPFWYSLLRRS